eukprot:13228302-Ditylum_brightwellii.AAC.1
MSSPGSGFYYAPNTYKELKLARLRRQNQPTPESVNPSDAVTIRTVLTSGSPFYSAWKLFSVVLGPYLLIHFFLTPLRLMFIGDYFGIENMYWSA